MYRGRGQRGYAPSRPYDPGYNPPPETRGGYADNWSSGQSGEGPASPRSVPLDHNLVITVGNDRANNSADRDYNGSRARSRGCSKSRHKSLSRSPDRSRNKSCGRSRSRVRSRTRSGTRSRSRSRSRSSSRERSRGRSRERSYSKGRAGRRSRSSSASSYGKPSKKCHDSSVTQQPTKSILKRRADEDSPSVRAMDTPRIGSAPSDSVARMADQLVTAVRGLQPAAISAMLAQLKADPHMGEAEFRQIVELLESRTAVSKASHGKREDIDDEELFLYGDTETSSKQANEQPIRSQELYRDVTEDDLYGDLQPASQDQRFSGIPPGTEPLEPGERQALEEYEKVQDLLKTIGLDLNVADISKMAARTKERLQGNRPKKSPPRRRRYSSSESSRSRSSSSSRSCSYSPRSDRDQTQDQMQPASDAAPPSLPPPQHPAMNMSYSSTQVHGMMQPYAPPPGYLPQYSYMAYPPPQWPPMYPPPTLPYAQYTDGEKDRHFNDEQNNESQKLKVLEEREKLKQDRDVRMKKKEYLMKELERLRKQQGELLRKKRREKDGHKDPLLQEISRLQEEVMSQISALRREHEAAEKKRTEIEAVAAILGLAPSDRPRKSSEQKEPPAKKKRERSPEARCSKNKSPEKSATPPRKVTTPPRPAATPPRPVAQLTQPAAPPAVQEDQYDYYDAGNHWCKSCNVTSGAMFDFFTHLHSKAHRKTLDPYDRPWAPAPTKISKNESSVKLTKPAKGSEFMLPARGFFCLLCKEFYGDAICAEEHVTKHSHNEKYKKLIQENPVYEQKRNLDRQAAGAKRKPEELKAPESKPVVCMDAESKLEPKLKKKVLETEEFTLRPEEVPKHKLEIKIENKPEPKVELKLDPKLPDPKPLERPGNKRLTEDDKPKPGRKEDKYSRYSREEDERRDKYRREEDRRYDDRYDDYRYKGRRYDSRYDDRYEKSKYRDEDRTKPRSKESKKQEPKKELELPPRPYDPPKVMCGPSPAMRAKLKKQNQEAAKAGLSPVAATSFSKFTWKKKEPVLAKEKENVLLKEAQKVAAAFIKDDEVKPSGGDEDAFQKSMAAAKEIAEKLSQSAPAWAKIRPGQQNRKAKAAATPPSDQPVTAEQNAPPPQVIPTKEPPPVDPPPLPMGPAFPPPAFPPPSFPPPSYPPYPPPTGLLPPINPSIPPPPLVMPPAVQAYPTLAPPPAVVPPQEAQPVKRVYVKPAAFSTSLKPQEKFSTSMAAAKAQDLFGILFNSSSMGPTSVNTKATSSTKAMPAFTKTPSSPVMPITAVNNTTDTKPTIKQGTAVAEAFNPPAADATESRASEQTGLQVGSVQSNKPGGSARKDQTDQQHSKAVAPLVLPEPEDKPQRHDQEDLAQAASEADVPQETTLTHEGTPDSKRQVIQVEAEIKDQVQTEPEPDQPAACSQTQPAVPLVESVSERLGQTKPEQSPTKTQPLKPKQAPEVSYPEPDPKPGPRTRGRKKAKPVKICQTRCQTRYHTRRQQQHQAVPEPEMDTASHELKPEMDPVSHESEPEMEPMSHESEPEANLVSYNPHQAARLESDSDVDQEQDRSERPEPGQEEVMEVEMMVEQSPQLKVTEEAGLALEPEAGLALEPETSLVLEPEAGQVVAGAPVAGVTLVELTAETLGLPSDMTALDFDYDFHFE